jgi:hypothetical protein
MYNMSQNSINLFGNVNELTPPPDEINIQDGKMMWVINGYRIWARSYQEALELLPLIESF